MKKHLVILVLFFSVLTISLVVYVAWLYRPGRYTILDITHRTTVTSGEYNWKVCLKIDSLTGRTWILEGSDLKTHSDKYFREIPSKPVGRFADILSKYNIDNKTTGTNLPEGFILDENVDNKTK